MKRRRFIYSEDGAAGEVHLTPLIDVVFVVLILFILVSPMLNIDKIELAIGGTKEHQTLAENDHIRIDVFANNEIQLNHQIITPQQLVPALTTLKKTTSYPPRLFCDQHAQFGTFQMIKGALEHAGYEELDIVLKP